MTEYEAYDLAMSSISFNHNLGESILSQIQFWAGVSYALLAITLVAPQKLTIGMTPRRSSMIKACPLRLSRKSFAQNPTSAFTPCETLQ